MVAVFFVLVNVKLLQGVLELFGIFYASDVVGKGIPHMCGSVYH